MFLLVATVIRAGEVFSTPVVEVPEINTAIHSNAQCIIQSLSYNTDEFCKIVKYIHSVDMRNLLVEIREYLSNVSVEVRNISAEMQLFLENTPYGQP